MKRIIAVLIAACYLCLSAGFVLHEHYCMGKLVSTSLTKPGETHKCSQCGMQKSSSNNGCCKDEYKIIKAKDDATFVKAFIQYSLAPDAVLPAPIYYVAGRNVLSPEVWEGTSGQPHGPPLAGQLRLYIRNSVFLI